MELQFLSVHGKGGFPWNDVYEMPVRVRKLCIMKLQELLEQEAQTAGGHKGQVPEKGKVYGPGFSKDGSKGMSPKINRPHIAPKRK